MNGKVVLRTDGMLLLVEAVLLLLPGTVSIVYQEYMTALAYFGTAVVAALLGAAAAIWIRPKNSVIYAPEGFAIVSIAWVLLSLVGAVPMVLSGDIPSYIDAVFETVSGFTTTGATVVDDVEALSHGTLFWRSFSHWVGGMGVLVFMMAIVSNITERPIHIMRAEMPGPQVGKLMPRVKDTAKILYLIYIIMTFIEVVLLLFGGMPFFESLLHAFGTAGTGGFGIKADSITSYSPYLQWVIGIFMMLFGINFNLYYLLLLRKFREVFKSRELWCYLGTIAISTGIITLDLLRRFGAEPGLVRTAFFQVSSIITTTGYSTADFNQWPELAKGILIVLMFVGGCAGSTSGGLKLSRVMLMFRMMGCELRHSLHPRSVNTVMLDGKKVDDETLNTVSSYFMFYIVILIAIFVLLCFDEQTSFETDVTAAISCFNNVGPGLGQIGPAYSYSVFSPFSKIVLSLAMLFGRLEIFPMIVSISPSLWRRS